MTLCLFHRYDKKTILPGCRERLDCGKCGRAGKERESHSWGPWESARHTYAIYRFGQRIDGSEHIESVQRRSCVRCNFIREEKI